ncbi:reverse transcriptase domain-containing protein [Tanacetum coccineum]
MAQIRAVAPSTYHLLLPLGTPPLLSIPLPAPSTSLKADIPEADTPPQKRLLLTAPRPRGEVGESFATAAARQPGPTMTQRVDYSFVDTVETRVRDTERRMMAAVEVVVDVRSRESSEFVLSIITRMPRMDHAAVRVRLRGTFLIRGLRLRRHEWQRQAADNFAVRHIMRTQALEASACVDTLEDTASRWYRSFVLISYPCDVKIGTKEHKVSTPVTPAPTSTTTTVTEAQLQALIDQGVAAAMAEAEASRVRNGHNSNGTEGVVGLTRWFEKMESVFSISNCTTSYQVKFVTCTLQDDALTWWNAHVKTTAPEAVHAIPWVTLRKMMTDKYCPRGKIKKIKTEMWNLKVKDTDVVAYSRQFQQLALMCSKMFPEEIDKIEKYIGGLPDMIMKW